MSMTIKEAKEFILDYINKTYMDITDFEITEALYHDFYKYWEIKCTFDYKITNRTNCIKFSCRVKDDGKLRYPEFKPR